MKFRKLLSGGKSLFLSGNLGLGLKIVLQKFYEANWQNNKIILSA